MTVRLLVLTVLATMLSISPAMAAASPTVVLELYTSQGCSSCPPADDLLKRLAANDPTLLPLSFHVHYWDYLGWKDPYSSSVNTDRQKAYAQVLADHQIYTPQLIVNGAAAIVGSRSDEVQAAIEQAKKNPTPLAVAIAAKDAGHLVATVMRNGSASINGSADILEVHFKKAATTHVGAGENSDRTLENINNVTSIKKIGTWQDNGQPQTFNLDAMTDDGVAVLVQAPQQGMMWGAGAYVKPS